MKTIVIEHSDIIDIDSDTSMPKQQTKGDLLIFADKIVYMRHTDTDTGLIRMVTGVDINIRKNRFNSILNELNV